MIVEWMVSKNGVGRIGADSACIVCVFDSNISEFTPSGSERALKLVVIVSHSYQKDCQTDVHLSTVAENATSVSVEV